jgi:hypothetical protein
MKNRWGDRPAPSTGRVSVVPSQATVDCNCPTAFIGSRAKPGSTRRQVRYCPRLPFDAA